MRLEPEKQRCQMELHDILKRIDAVPAAEGAAITQLRHEEDDEPYQVWKIDTGGAACILKQAKGFEEEIYRDILGVLNEGCVPAVYQTVADGERTYLLMEYAEGEDLRRCDRARLTLALDALISLQARTWESRELASCGYSLDMSLRVRERRGQFLKDALLEEAYALFMRAYSSVPRALCHDDLLPFNVIVSDDRAVLIDWEYGGILPYPSSFARLIAHGEEAEDALFHMTREDRDFAIDHYYDKLLRERGIAYADWRRTLELFLFYEYCEWVFVGHKYGDTESEYYKKYLPLARRQALALIRGRAE